MKAIERLRARGWGLLLGPLGLQYALLTSDDDNRRLLAVLAYLDS